MRTTWFKRAGSRPTRGWLRPWSTLLLLFVALPVLGQTTISTVSAWDGSSAAYSFGLPNGVAHDTYGQTFTVPSGFPSITDINFRVGYNFGQGLTLTGYLMAWNGSEVTGPVLFQSASATVDSSTMGLAVYDFPITNVTLTPGNTYVFFLMATSTSGGAATAQFAVTGSSASYAGGNFVFTDSGGNGVTNLTNPWVQPDTASVYGDAVFAATFTSNLGPAATPIFSPAAGSYTAAQRVTISDATPGVTIYYTTDGSTPPSSSSVLYSGSAITVSSTETLKAIATASGYSNSAVATAIYTISSSTTTSPGQWVWMNGSSMIGSNGGQSGVYGTLGTPAAGNIPGGRNSAASWTDGSGNFWLFGGQGFGSNSFSGYLNDLWQFNPVTNLWVWKGGSSTVPGNGVGQPGVYGTLGTPAAGNIPGGRSGASSWIDSGGNLWLFGGTGFDASSVNGGLNDLWEFNPSTKLWAWMSGSSTIPPGSPGQPNGQPGVYGTLGTPAAGNVPGARYSASSWTDSGGNLWLFGGYGFDVSGNQGWLNDVWEFNPSTKLWTWMGGSNTIPPGPDNGQPGVYGTLGTPAAGNIPGARYLASSWTDSSGHFWLFGGVGIDSSSVSGELNDLWEFNPVTKLWAWMSGSSTVGITGGQPGVYGTLGTPAAGNVPGGRSSASSWIDSSGNLWLFGGAGFDASDPPGILNDLWEFNTSTSQWAWAGGSSTVGQSGVYGTLGTPAPGNIPGGRVEAMSWTDTSGNFWLFGGEGFDAGGNIGFLNDLWEHQPAAASLPVVATPQFSLAAGTYNSAQTVSISDTTASATIYYTTDGSTPTTGSSAYSSAITVSSTETLEAIAIASGYSTSAVASAAYTITPPAATPTFSVAAGNYTSTQTVTISDATAGAIIYYTTDGSTPTTSSSVYSGAITISSSETLEAIATASGYSQSAVAAAAYTITPAAATPTFSPVAGSYTSTQTVTISDATAGATIYYTTNGSTPTTSSSVYSGAITVSSTETLEAIAIAGGYTTSAVASAAYTITPPAATPTFSVAAGTYTSTQTVTISDTTAGATIYYTTNGTTPTTSSSVYSGAITVASTETLKAIATASGYITSATASATYTITPPAATPTFSVAAGTYNSTQTVTISDATAGATIYYTTNGTAPTTSSSVYSSAITVASTETLEAIATASGYSTSAVATAAYTITPPAATPTFSVAAGTYTSTQTVTISDATAGATIYYTTNGTAPTTSSSVYSGAITVSSTETLEAIATASGYTTSAVASAAYTITPPAATPTFSPGAGTYTSAQTVTISDATTGATIYYTTNGTTPTTSSSVYSSAITVSSTETLEAIATASGYSTSAVAAAAYTIAPPASVNLSTSENVGSSTAAQAVTVYIAAVGIPSTIGVLTMGAPNLDFTQAPSPNGGTCTTTTSYTVGQTCTVNVVFTPKYPGQRLGAVVLTGSGGAVLGEVLLTGTGTGPQMVFPSNSTRNTVGSGFNQPYGVAVDRAGNVFVADKYNGLVKEIVAVNGVFSSSSTVLTVGSGFIYPNGVAVDGAGDVFVADSGYGAIKEIVAVNGAVSSSSTVLTVGSGFSEPNGVAVDGAGDVFVADYNAVYEIVAVNGAVSSSSTVLTVGSGFAGPYGVAVDASGNVFVTDSSIRVVKEIVAVNGAVSSSSTVLTVGIGFSDPQGVAVDAAGDVFVADLNNNDVREIVAVNGAVSSSSTVKTVGSGFGLPNGVAVDGAGNVFVADFSSYNTVTELLLATPPALTFASTAVGQTSSDSPQTVTVANNGNAALTLSGLTVTANNWTAATGGSNCSSTSSLAEGASCSLAISFLPLSPGSPLTGSMTLTDNSLNGTNATQSISLTGTGIGLAATPTFSPGAGTYTSTQTVSISDTTTGATIYYTTDGTTPTTKSSLYGSAIIVASTETLKAIATANGYSTSAVASAAYTITPPAATPQFSVAAGTYTSTQTVTISDATAGATIYYTTNGTTPTTSSSVYSGAITVSSTETLEAIAVGNGYSTSAVATATYTITPPAATPTFSPAAGTYTSTQTVTISDVTAGATIYYTNNGTTPTTSSSVYSGAITVSSTETLEAIATATGYSTSAVATAAYTLVNPQPAISGVSPAFTNAVGTAFTLTVNGSGFIASSTVYWGGSALATQYVSSIQLTAQVPAADIATVGTISITVQTPVPGGGTSNAWQFEVGSASSGTTGPTITTANATVTAGSTASYPVTVPSSVSNISVTCLNLPAGAACSYNSTTNAVTITTSQTTPKGTYQIVVVFTETVTSGAFLLPFLLLPLAFVRRKRTARGIWLTACLGLVLMATAALAIGSSGCASPQKLVQQVTSSSSVSLTVQ